MIGLKVRVYFNLHKKVYSVQSKKTGKVIAHVEKLLLKNAKFNVREGGRQKVLKEKRKNVHAFIEGEIGCPLEYMLSNETFGVTYNPYKYDSFVNKDDKSKVFKSDFAYLGLTLESKPVTLGGNK